MDNIMSFIAGVVIVTALLYVGWRIAFSGGGSTPSDNDGTGGGRPREDQDVRDK